MRSIHERSEGQTDGLDSIESTRRPVSSCLLKVPDLAPSDCLAIPLCLPPAPS